MAANEMIHSEMLNLDLLEAVDNALHELDYVRESELALHIDVQDEVVTVSGVVLSRIMRLAVLHAISQVPGVKRVVDRLYTDTDLAIAVSQALAVNPVTQKMYDIRVTSYRGQVTLVGKVADARVSQTAAELTSGISGVRAVVSRLTYSIAN